MKVAQNSFQHLDFDGNNPSLSLDAKIMDNFSYSQMGRWKCKSLTITHLDQN